MRIRTQPAVGFGVVVFLSAYLGLAPKVAGAEAIPDKVLHLIDFFLLSVLFYWSIDLPRRLVLKIAIGAMAGLSVASEFLQAVLPNGREFDAVDIAANLLGVFCGLALCTWYHKRMLERKRAARLAGYDTVGTEDRGAELDDLEMTVGATQETGVVDNAEEDDTEAWDDLNGGAAEPGEGEEANGASKT